MSEKFNPYDTNASIKAEKLIEERRMSKSMQKRINIQKGKPMDEHYCSYDDHTIQSEIIDWHKYPDGKPKGEGRYLLQLVYSELNCDNFVDRASWTGERWISSLQQSPIEEDRVIAWAEMPTGWNSKLQ